MFHVLKIGTLGCLQPARIVGVELSRIVTVNGLSIFKIISIPVLYRSGYHSRLPMQIQRLFHHLHVNFCYRDANQPDNLQFLI